MAIGSKDIFVSDVSLREIGLLKDSFDNYLSLVISLNTYFTSLLLFLRLCSFQSLFRYVDRVQTKHGGRC